MSKRILTVLAPVAAIMATMAIPSMAQATQAQCGGVECANGATLIGETANPEVALQNPNGTLTCTSGEASGTLTNSQGETLEGSVTSATLVGCKINGLTAHIATNASAVAPWKTQVQQPDANGQITGHLLPATGSTIRFTVQIQIFGGSVATCVFSANSIQGMGEAQSDIGFVEGTNQFTLVERSGAAASECGTVNTTTADLSGSQQTQTTSGVVVVAHMD